jgi:hypothetical protein
VGLGLGLKLEISQPIDETYAMKIVRERMSRPTTEVVEVLSVLRVAHRTLRKVDQRLNRIVTDIG